MAEQSVNNKRIAKNTLLLYSRTILVLFVTLYTTKVVLKALGVVDYGINNVVGGVVVMFGFLNSSMSSATQRFISFAIGQNNKERLSRVFGTSVLIHYVIAGVIFVLSELVGLWLLYTHMDIPSDRMTAAFIVFQCSIVAFVVNVISVPYNADIVSHENMNVFAMVSIVEVALKLIVAFIVLNTSLDRLIIFAFLNLAVSVIIRIIYQIYCSNHYEESRTRSLYDKSLFYEMFSFASWNIIGNMAFAFRNQGSNILLNMFFGPAVNAARGVSHQVDSAVEQFVTNLQTAANPQIIKSYANENYSDSIQLTNRISKFSFFLILVLGLPVIFNIEKILSLWLDSVPEYATQFTVLILVNGIIDSISKPLKTLVKATGQVKWYMIIQGGWYLLALPTIYTALKLGYGPISSVLIIVVFTILGTFIRLFLVRAVTEHFSIMNYLKSVLIPTTLTAVCSVVMCQLVSLYVPDTNIMTLLIRIMFIVLFTIITVVLIGFNKEDRLLIFNFIKKTLCRRKI